MLKITEPRKPFGPFGVTAENIACGVRCDPTSCPVALGLRDRGGDALLEVRVMKTITELIWSGGVLARYATPAVLRDGLKNFDDTGDWKLLPGSYVLPPVPPKRLSIVAKKLRSAGKLVIQR